MARISKLGTNTLSEKALSGNLNFLSPIGFRFQLQRAPNVEYFCQSVTLPTLSINEAIMDFIVCEPRNIVSLSPLAFNNLSVKI